MPYLFWAHFKRNYPNTYMLEEKQNAKLHVVHQPYTKIDRKKGITGGDHQTISNVKV